MEHLKRPFLVRFWRHLLSMPFIYSLVVPLALLDLWLEIYHRICFPLYGIPYIRRSEYIRIDRHRLPYLNLRQKVHCAYCGYANGLLAYAARVAAETERYWCGIKHKQDPGRIFYPPQHHSVFFDYGDARPFAKGKKQEV